MADEMIGVWVIFGTVFWILCGIQTARIYQAWFREIYDQNGLDPLDYNNLDPIHLFLGPIDLWIVWDERHLLRRY